MAASAAAAAPSPGLCPSFAVICSFLERYGAQLDLPELTFPQLERYLQDTASVPKLLVDLHVKLLRKIGKSVTADRWEKYLVKVCQDFNSTWAWELEKKGYQEMTVECKTGILKYLCECQFDDNVKFKTAINEEDPDQMRVQPIGRDKDGLMYWFQLDQDQNVRVYVEEQDDLDGSSWKCVVRNRNDLAQILALLKTQIDPSLFVKKDQEEESSKTNLNPEEEKSMKNDGEDEIKSAEVNEDAAKNGPAKTETGAKLEQNDSVKQELLEEKESIQESKDVKEEGIKTDKSDSQPADGLLNVMVKEEPMEEEPIKSTSITSEKDVTPKVLELKEEAKKKSEEEIQRALKNDKQAKIPLKKREMKLTEDFDSNIRGSTGSSIIVRNPAVKEVQPVREENGFHCEKVNGDDSGDLQKDFVIKQKSNREVSEPQKGDAKVKETTIKQNEEHKEKRVISSKMAEKSNKLEENGSAKDCTITKESTEKSPQPEVIQKEKVDESSSVEAAGCPKAPSKETPEKCSVIKTTDKSKDSTQNSSELNKSKLCLKEADQTNAEKTALLKEKCSLNESVSSAPMETEASIKESSTLEVDTNQKDKSVTSEDSKSACSRKDDASSTTANTNTVPESVAPREAEKQHMEETDRPFTPEDNSKKETLKEKLKTQPEKSDVAKKLEETPSSLETKKSADVKSTPDACAKKM